MVLIAQSCERENLTESNELCEIRWNLVKKAQLKRTVTPAIFTHSVEEISRGVEWGWLSAPTSSLSRNVSF